MEVLYPLILAEIPPESGHVPLSGRRAPDLLGGPVPAQRRERRKTAIYADSPRRPRLKTTLARAAWAAARLKNTCLRAQSLRLNGRRGPKKAILAAPASMPAAACPILRNGVPYPDLGPLHFDRRDKIKRVNRLPRRAAGLGFQVEIRPAA
jgi:hypothetical protein